MKLLFLANRVPYPPHRGDKLKIYNLAKRLCKEHDLTLLCFTERNEEKQHLPKLQEIFKEVHFVHLPLWQSVLNAASGLWRDAPFQVLYFKSAAMQHVVDKLLKENNFDAVHVQHLRMSPYLAHHAEVPRILDLPDAFSLYWKRRKDFPANPLKRMFESIEQKKVYRYERTILVQFNKVLVCSREDQEYLAKEHNADNVYLLPNGVDLSTFSGPPHDYSRIDTLLFTGNMDYAPNVDAVIYFSKEIWPEILKRHPQMSFVIAGQRPVLEVQALANGSNRVVVTGFVPDIAEMYQKASIVVAPLRFGAGTQNKVLEALAMGVPVVCSNIGFAGLGIGSGEGAFMETTPDGFINAIEKLIQSEDLRKSAGEKGASHVRQHFDWDIISRQLSGYFTTLK